MKLGQLLAGDNPPLDVARTHRNRRPIRFLAELKERKVIRATFTYAVALWLALQVADVGLPILDAPESAMKLTVALGALGFPVVMVLAWLFEITPRGIVLDTRADRLARKEDAGRVDLLINAGAFALVLALAGAISFRLLLDDAAVANLISPDAAQDETVALHIGYIGGADGLAAPVARRIESELRHRLIGVPRLLLVRVPDDRGDSPSIRPRLYLSVDLYIYDGAVRVIANLLDTKEGVYRYSTAFEIAPSEANQEVAAADQIIAAVRAAISNV